MNKTLSKSKNKKIVGGNNFTFSALSFDNNINRTEFEAKKENINVKLIFYKKENKDTPLNIKKDDIIDNKNLKIITSNITDAKYYEPNTGNYNGELNKNKIVENMNKFDTCVIVVFENICYIFLYVNTSGYGAIKEFDKNIEIYNLKALDALMIAHFKKLKLNIIFVNNFLAVVKGYIDGYQNQAVKPKQTTTKLDETTSDQEGAQRGAQEGAQKDAQEDAQEGGKKINTNKILNNLILKLSKINNVKNFSETKATKPTKPKATKPTKPKATKPTKPNLTKPKVIKPTKPKATKPTKPKPSKPKVTKPKATKKI